MRGKTSSNAADFLPYEHLSRTSRAFNAFGFTDSSNGTLYEARNALWIALWAGAGKNAGELFDKAERSLEKAEAFHASGAGVQQVLTAARETVQTAENARATAMTNPVNFQP